MLVMMAVSLYTSRVILASLGIEDYGIYNVVGGIVVILSFLNGAIATSTQRFLNVELGKGNSEGLRKVFSTSVIIHLVIAAVGILIAETLGLFFLNNFMNINPSRLKAATWVFHFSVAAFALNITSIPYLAAIIAHEKMSAFAYISIIEAVIKLGIAYVICYSSFDKLILYAFLLFVLSFAIRLMYIIYCKLNFLECKKLLFVRERRLFKDMLSFASWTVVGNLALIFHTQGLAIIFNIFFGATVNAAQGVSNQVNGAVNNFVQNFMTAVKPQVVKSYAAGNLNGMYDLLISGSKLAFFLVLLFVVPLTMETPKILNLWLKEVPDYTVIFIRLLLFITLFNSFNSILNAAQGATGNIKKYMITQTSIDILHLPISFILFKLNFAPYFALIVYLIIVIITQVTRISFVCSSTGLSMPLFYKRVVLRGMSVLVVAYILSLLLKQILFDDTIFFVLPILIYVFLCLSSIYVIGLNCDEKKYVKQFLVKKLWRKDAYSK